jgi:hypothetical protein
MPGFLAPLFMLGALAAAVPIVLHLLKREPEARVRFAAVKLLQLAPVEQSARRRLREWLLLALRVAAIVLLSLAFARPFFSADVDAETAGVVVVALDTSFSLSAPGRFEQAQELARSAIRQAPPDALVAVVRFADDAEVVTVPTPDRTRALAAVDAARVGFGATRYRPALLAAAGLITERGEGDGTIVVVTDAQQIGWAPDDGVVVPEPIRLELADVGPLVPNLALTDVRLTGGRVTVAVRNLALEAREARVRLLVDEVTAGEAAVSLGPNQAGSVALPLGDGGTLAEVRVEDPDGLQADNVRYLVLEGRSATPVLIVTASGNLEREAFFVQQALLAAGPSGAAYQVEGVSVETFAGWPVTRLHDYAAITILSTQGLDRRGRELVREYAMRGGRLLVAAGPGVDGDVVAGAIGRGIAMAVPAEATADPRGERRALTPVDVRHPVFRRLEAAGGTLGLATFQRVASLGSAECGLLARFTTGEPALVECTSDGGRTLVFASDLNQAWNDFPRHGTFVPFLHEVVNYLSEGRRWASEYRVADVPTEIARTPGFVTLPSLRVEGQTRVVAINVDAEESEPARLTAEAFASAVTRTAPAPADGAPVVERPEPLGQQAWRYLLWLMLGVLVAESMLGRRTA